MPFKNKAVEFVYRLATGTKKIRAPLTPIGATFFGLITALFVILALYIDGILYLTKFPVYPVNIILSIPILLFGAFLCMWTVILFVKAKGTPVPINPPKQIITKGPYAYCRNPMLTGIYMLLIGLSFLFQSLSLLLIFIPLYMLIHLLELKYIEEPELEKRFGEEYLAYKRNTPMFIPKKRKNS